MLLGYFINSEDLSTGCYLSKIEDVIQFQLKHPGIFKNQYSLDEMKRLIEIVRQKYEATWRMEVSREQMDEAERYEAMLPALELAAIEAEFAREENRKKGIEKEPKWCWISDTVLEDRKEEIEAFMDRCLDPAFKKQIIAALRVEIDYLIGYKKAALTTTYIWRYDRDILERLMSEAEKMGVDLSGYRQRLKDITRQEIALEIAEAFDPKWKGNRLVSKVEKIKKMILDAKEDGIDVSEFVDQIPLVEAIELWKTIDERFWAPRSCVDIFKIYFNWRLSFWKRENLDERAKV